MVRAEYSITQRKCAIASSGVSVSLNDNNQCVIINNAKSYSLIFKACAGFDNVSHRKLNFKTTENHHAG